MICFASFKLKLSFCKGCISGEEVLSGKAGFYSLSHSQLLFEETAQDYIVDVRCDAGRVFEHTSYFETVCLSNTVQLRLLVNCSGMLELLESLLECLVQHCFSLLLFLLCFLSGRNKDVLLFDLCMSSLMESDIYTHYALDSRDICESTIAYFGPNRSTSRDAVTAVEFGLLQNAVLMSCDGSNSFQGCSTWKVQSCPKNISVGSATYFLQQ